MMRSTTTATATIPQKPPGKLRVVVFVVVMSVPVVVVPVVVPVGAAVCGDADVPPGCVTAELPVACASGVAVPVPAAPAVPVGALVVVLGFWLYAVTAQRHNVAPASAVISLKRALRISPSKEWN